MTRADIRVDEEYVRPSASSQREEGLGKSLGTGQISGSAPREIVVAILLSMSGGFLDAFTWLSYHGVFSSSQTGNVVFLGLYAALGKWHESTRHIPPIAAFLAGAWIAFRVRTSGVSLWVAIVVLAIVILAPSGTPDALIVFGIALSSAMVTAEFRIVERWNFSSVTVTGNLLRALEQLAMKSNPLEHRGAQVLLSICFAFLAGAVAGSFATVHLEKYAVAMPIVLLTIALWLDKRRRHHEF